MDHAVQKRNLKVTLGGDLGNMGLSYNGLELLPELLSSGRWLHLVREARALVKSRRMRWRGVMANTLGPWCPENLWRWLNRKVNGHALEIGNYAALNPRRLAELDIVRPSKSQQPRSGLSALEKWLRDEAMGPAASGPRQFSQGRLWEVGRLTIVTRRLMFGCWSFACRCQRTNLCGVVCKGRWQNVPLQTVCRLRF